MSRFLIPCLTAFLLLGPVIDLKSISLFSRIFRRRGILLMLAGVVVAVLFWNTVLFVSCGRR